MQTALSTVGRRSVTTTRSNLTRNKRRGRETNYMMDAEELVLPCTQSDESAAVTLHAIGALRAGHRSARARATQHTCWGGRCLGPFFSFFAQKNLFVVVLILRSRRSQLGSGTEMCYVTAPLPIALRVSVQIYWGIPVGAPHVQPTADVLRARSNNSFKDCSHLCVKLRMCYRHDGQCRLYTHRAAFKLE